MEPEAERPRHQQEIRDMRKFLIQTGYSTNDLMQIDHTEVEKAIYCHITGAVGVFSSGSISGKHIIKVVPDYNAELGWPPDHKLDGYDYNDLDRQGLRGKYMNFLSEQRERVNYLIESKQEHLIGKGVPLPELKRYNEVRGGGPKEIGGLLGKGA